MNNNKSAIDPVTHQEVIKRREFFRTFTPLCQRNDGIWEATRRFEAMSPEDRKVWLRMLKDGGDYDRLVTTCNRITAAMAEPAILPDGSLPPNRMITTPHEHVALAGLLGTVRDHRRLVLL